MAESDPQQPLPEVPRQDDGRRRHQNAADPDQVRRQRERLKREESLEREDWKWLATHPQGRRIIAILLKPIGDNSFDTHSNTMSFMEGRRSIARALREKIMHLAPEILIPILQEEIRDAVAERAQVER